MLKKTLLLLFSVFIYCTTLGQSADTVYNQYLDFNLAKLQGEQDKVLELGEVILPKADLLPGKARINFYFSVGKMYEDNDQPDKAVVYYEKVAAAVPDYYVVHRALGYLYLDKSNRIVKQLNASANDKVMNAQLHTAYVNATKQALPHLEKAEACDHSDETLETIKNLYKGINDLKGLNTLGDRLKALSKNCIDILTDK
ncbi:MAG: hypothetical protein JWQ84_3125 [Mucilaginibacter sp.]|nr:hypothetical protein [Mucilaginibacter sp.]MDB5018293.1 hypothetical protein [Mucilaginibacter sp.]